MIKLIRQFLKFGMVGVFCFLIDFGIFTLLNNVLGVYYLIANFFGFTISVIVNYIMSMKYVFVRKDDANKRLEFIIFVVLSVIGLFLTELIIWVCVDGIYVNVAALTGLMSRKAAEVLGKIIATGVVMIYNFVTRKIFLEKKG